MKPLTPDRLPAILIGGPPNAGKSVLSHALKEALSRAGVDCYLLRAAKDGEGDWFLVAPEAVAKAERHSGPYTQAWVEAMCRDIARRPLPFLVDVGGKPKPWQEEMFSQCTHAILLVKDEASLAFWRSLVERNGLETIAILTSRLNGESTVEENEPILRGIITGLQRREPVGGPVFTALTQRVQEILAFPPEELEKVHWRQAPTDMVVDIPTMYRHLHPDKQALQWVPEDLTRVFDYLPNDEILALYGRGPGWLYAAVVNYSAPLPFYQFDARLGWVPPVQCTNAAESELPIEIRPKTTEHYLHLDVTLTEHYLDYAPHMALPLPDVPVDRGVILEGRLPLWLYTGLALHYQTAPWVAIYYPHLDQAVIVATRATNLKIGETIKLLDLTLPHPNTET